MIILVVIPPAIHRIIPKLELGSLTDTELLEYAQDKVHKLTLAGESFPGINPSISQVQSKHDEFETALTNADNGTVAQTAYKNQIRAELEALLTLQAGDASRIANGNMALYLLSGYRAKNTHGHPHGELPMVTNLELFYGDSDGELKASWNPIPDADNFSVQIFSDVMNPDGSLLKEEIIGKIGKQKTILSGLPTGQKVFVRVRANGGSTGQGPWSDIAEKRVP